jgi:hypothetical protein
MSADGVRAADERNVFTAEMVVTLDLAVSTGGLVPENPSRAG